MVEYYNLDMIISVGYRVKSKNGVTFRKWANKALKEYLIKGYAINNSNLFALERNKGLDAIIDNNTLVAITLLIAQSNPKEKEILIDLLMNFLKGSEPNE